MCSFCLCKGATYWDIFRLGSCQTYQLRMGATSYFFIRVSRWGVPYYNLSGLLGLTLIVRRSINGSFLISIPPSVTTRLRCTSFILRGFSRCALLLPRLFRCYFFTEVYAAIASGFSSAISLIKTYWGGCPYLPEGCRVRPQTTVPLYLSSSGEPQMPISALFLQLFILVLCPRPKLCTGVSSFTYGREFHEIINLFWTVKGSKKRRNRIERGKMVKVKDTLFFLFFQLFTLILYHLFRFFAIFRHSNF